MKKELRVTIVGPGRLGSTLARALHAAGVPVVEVVYRAAGSRKSTKRLARLIGAKAAEFKDAGFGETGSFARLNGRGRPFPHQQSDVVWICVGDSAIAKTASEMAGRRPWKGTTVFHSSGALAADELEPLRRAGAKVASVHPMMSFVGSSTPSMKGVAFALEGDAAAVTVAKKLVKRLGGYSFQLAKEDKPLYHAMGAFVSPLIVAQMATAERIGRELGLSPRQTRKIVAPILLQTVRNYIEHGPAAAFSGPIVRGDAGTIRSNLEALCRVAGAAEIYRALAKVAVQELPSKDAAGIRKAIEQIS